MPIYQTGALDRFLSSFRSGIGIAWAIALIKLLLHTYFNDRYGYFRDEFDYLSCGQHLAWGYVDQPPLIPFLTELSRSILGDSLRAIRFIPALASSLLVVQTAVLTRELGGKFFAIVLAAICVALAPQYLSNGSLLGTNSLEPSLWMGCAYFAITAIKRNDARQWLWFGVVAGIGLEEKYTIGLFCAGVVIGLLLTAQRRFVVDRWFWLGTLAALLIFLPNLIWNYANDWPFVQLMQAIKAEGRDVVLSPIDYFVQQMLLVNPLTAPLWLIGLAALLISDFLKPYRCLGWCYLVCYAALFLSHGKNYYLAPIYPMLLAAGALTLERALTRLQQQRQYLRWLKALSVIVALAGGIYLAPIVVPALSPDAFVEYAKSLPFKLPVMEHSHARATLPQWYSDQFGWREIADETAVAWNQLPVDQRTDCGIFAQDYGQAGAIDFFGAVAGLPAALSGDRTYFLWGPRNYSGECMIVLGDRRDVLERYWQDVEFVGTSAPNTWALEAEIPVYICRHKKFASLTALWPTIKHWR
jgi:4-amino-4-deoxy-L-arabinose transferase-like glycosyltransferase